MQELKHQVESFWKKRNRFLLLLIPLLVMIISVTKIMRSNCSKLSWYEFFAKYSLKPVTQDKLCQQGNLILVKILNGEFWGSGFLIGNEKNRYSLITNGHILKKDKEIYEIQTYDGKIHEASLIVRFDHGAMTGNDLAILEFNSDEKYKIARLGQWYAGQTVMAAGYPLQIDPQNIIKDNCTAMGEVWYKLPKPMKRGYQLGYSLSIHNGMSGGPLLNNQGQVIGINGMTIPSLFINEDIYLYRDGTRVSNGSISLNSLSKQSWAIPTETIINLMPSSISLKY